jgi:hypothetical protein
MKKILATASAVVLSLAMVAMPSIAVADEVESTETVTTETVTTEVVTEPVVTEPVVEPVVEEPAVVAPTSGQSPVARNESNAKDEDPSTPCDQLGYTKFNSASGSETLMSGATEIGTLVWSGTSLTYTLNPGWTIDLCIKSGSQVGTVEYDDISGTSTITIAQDISHIGWKDPQFTEEPTEVTPDATFVDEVCEEEEDVLVPGVITVDLSVVGVTYSITQGGNPVPFDAVTGKTGPLTAGLTYIVTATADTGYVLSGPYEEQFTPSDESEGCGEVATSVTPDATFVDESCNVQTKDVTPGVITVDLTVVGVTYSITQGGNPVPFDAVTGETGPLTSGLTYIVTATANPGYVIPVPYEEQFTPTSAAIDCETLPLVVPFASQDPGCELPSSFTIGNDLSDPAALTWTANGNPITEGTHAVNGKTTITLVATANGPDYGIADGAQTEWTFSFPEDETCDLTTLALTGSSDTTPALALTAFLGLLGLAMVRSGIRVNRSRQEA